MPSLSILQVSLPHQEITILVYDDVVASALITILIVSNVNATIIVDVNASAVSVAIRVEFSVVLVAVWVYFGLE